MAKPETGDSDSSPSLSYSTPSTPEPINPNFHRCRPPPSPSPASSSPLPPSSHRLWRPAAQRNLRNQWSKLSSYRQKWTSLSSSGRSHATSLVNSFLSQRYMDSIELGVLSDMLNIREKACHNNQRFISFSSRSKPLKSHAPPLTFAISGGPRSRLRRHQRLRPPPHHSTRHLCRHQSSKRGRGSEIWPAVHHILRFPTSIPAETCEASFSLLTQQNLEFFIPKRRSVLAGCP